MTRHTRRWAACGLLALAAPWAQAGLWLDDAGHPRAAAREAVQWLTSAEQQGLRPADYDAQQLSSALAEAERHHALPPDAATQLDERLTRHVLDYLGDLRHGRADPARVQARYDSATAPAPDLAASLRDALARGQLQDAQRAALPPWRQYADLQQALVHYRGLGDHPAWHTRLPALPGGKLQPGQRCWPASTASRFADVTAVDTPPAPTNSMPCEAR